MAASLSMIKKEYIKHMVIAAGVTASVAFYIFGNGIEGKTKSEGIVFEKLTEEGAAGETGNPERYFHGISIRQFFRDQHLRRIGADEHCGGNVLIYWHLFLLFRLLFFSFLPLYNVARKMNCANEIFHGWMTTLCFELK